MTIKRHIDNRNLSFVRIVSSNLAMMLSNYSIFSDWRATYEPNYLDIKLMFQSSLFLWNFENLNSL